MKKEKQARRKNSGAASPKQSQKAPASTLMGFTTKPAAGGAAPGAATEGAFSPEEAAEYARKRKREFNSRLELDLYHFLSELSEQAALVLLSEALVRHETDLRAWCFPKFQEFRGRCDGLAALQWARAVVECEREAGWDRVKDEGLGDAGLEERMRLALPGVARRIGISVRDALFVMADFLYANRLLIVEEVILELKSVTEALELAEVMALAEKVCHRGGAATELDQLGEGGLTMLMELALRLFEASQKQAQWDVADIVWDMDFMAGRRQAAEGLGRAKGAAR